MNNIALITGATSGIGRAFARRFASMGYDLIMTGRRREIIQAAALEISEGHGVKANVVLAELSEEKGVRKVLDAIEKAGAVHALVNNAGFGLGKLFHAEDAKNHERMIAVHVTAAVRLVRAVVPGMLDRGSGIIINVSSLGAFLPTPFNSVYGGTKAFLDIFTRSLHTEIGHRGIRLQCLCPGFTSTDFHKQMGIEEEIKRQVKKWMEPEEVVECSMKALSRGGVVCIPGFQNKLLRILPLVMPAGWYYRAVRHMYGTHPDE
jgi:uncharacterized protein